MKRTKSDVIKELLELGIWNIDKNDSMQHLESLLSIWKSKDNCFCHLGNCNKEFYKVNSCKDYLK